MLFIYFVVFVLGLLWGSFCNVCIYRLPSEGNIVTSRSKCRSCNKVIRWFDNIPLISYIILQAKCRNCKININFRYFFVELATAIIFLTIFYLYGTTLTTLLLIVLPVFFIIIFFYWSRSFYNSKWIDLSFDDNRFFEIIWSQY